MRLEPSRYILEKSSNINVHKNPSSGSRVVSCGWTDVTKEVVPFRVLETRPKSFHKVFVRYPDTPSLLWLINYRHEAESQRFCVCALIFSSTSKQNRKYTCTLGVLSGLHVVGSSQMAIPI